MTIRFSNREIQTMRRQLTIPVANLFFDLFPNLNFAAGVRFSIGAETANVILVTVNVDNQFGGAAGGQVALDFYISSNADGSTVGALDTAIAAGTGSIVLGGTVSLGTLVTNSAGVGILSMTNATALSRYLNIILPSGRIVRSPVITWT
jgi:hypothetical protein